MAAMLPRFLKNTRGATILEFAIVAPFFFVLLFAILEYGLFLYHKIAIESITAQAGREASLVRNSKGVPGDVCFGRKDQVDYIQCIVESKAESLMGSERITFDVQRVDDGGEGTLVPDICVDDATNPNSAVQTCTLFEEVNNIPDYQGARQTQDAGTFGQLVEVRVNYPWKLMIPFLGAFVGREVQTQNGPVRTNVIMITSSIVIRNEPL